MRCCTITATLESAFWNMPGQGAPKVSLEGNVVEGLVWADWKRPRHLRLLDNNFNETFPEQWKEVSFPVLPPHAGLPPLLRALLPASLLAWLPVLLLAPGAPAARRAKRTDETRPACAPHRAACARLA